MRLDTHNVAWALIIINCGTVITLFFIDSIQCDATETKPTTQAQNVQEFFSKLGNIREKTSFKRTVSSLINEYLCQALPGAGDDVARNERELIRLRQMFYHFEQNPDLEYYNSRKKLYNLLNDKLIIYIQLFDLRRKGHLCSIDAQSAFAAIDLEIQANLGDLKSNARGGDTDLSEQNLEFDFHPIKVFACNRLKLIGDHYHALRRQECNQQAIQVLDANLQVERQLIAMLANGFMDSVVGKSGYSLETCLNSWLFSGRLAKESVASLIAGFRTLVEAQDKPDMEAESMFSGNETQPLKFSLKEQEETFVGKFVKYRNKYLVDPCRIFINNLKDKFDSIKLYESMFGDHTISNEPSKRTIELKFESPMEEKRFIRAWSMLNTCRYVILPRLAQLSLAIMKQLGYDFEASKMNQRQLTRDLTYKLEAN